MKDNIGRKGLVIGIILLFVLAGVIPSIGRTVIERQDSQDIRTSVKDFNPRGNILYVGGSGPNNYTKIQNAIDDASDGDTVFVYDDSSPYYENVIINKSIKLIGEDRTTTIIDGNDNDSVIHVVVDKVNINGFTIRNGIRGIELGEQNFYIDDSVIRSNTITSNGCGIEMCGEGNIIEGNIIKSNNGNGIHSWRSFDGNTITSNIISSNGDNGISFSGGNKNNIITNNFISDNRRDAIYIHSSSWSSKSENNIITDNNILNNYGGIVLGGSYSTVTGNTFISNNGCGIILYYGYNLTVTYNFFFYDGIRLSPFTNQNTVTNNVMNCKPMLYLEGESNKVIDYNVGQVIILDCDNITIENQDISNTGYGIQLSRTRNSKILNNYLSNNVHGICLWYSEFNTINNNQIKNNKYGIQILWETEYNTIIDNIISKNGFGIKLYSNNNSIIRNNFHGNIINAFCDDCKNTWKQNYWNRPRLLPKLILGNREGSDWWIRMIPRLNIDWRPAQKPYDKGV